MGYSSITEVQRILANALTEGGIDVEEATPFLMNSTGTLPNDTIDSTTIIQYIKWADDTIDGSLSAVYQIPLKRIVVGEFAVLEDITTGEFTINIEDTTRFYVGDLVILTDGDTSEKKVIEEIVAETVVKFTSSTSSSFLAANSKLQRLKYPDPIPRLSSMYAASILYDKYFAAGQEPGASDYGKNLRTLFNNMLSNILSGRVKLIGQRPISKRFLNSALLDAPSVSADPKDSKGEV